MILLVNAKYRSKTLFTHLLHEWQKMTNKIHNQNIATII